MTLMSENRVEDDELVLSVLEAAGHRGASHEDFVEAGLARAYAESLGRLVEERGLEIDVDFTTGAARWALAPESEASRRSA